MALSTSLRESSSIRYNLAVERQNEVIKKQKIELQHFEFNEMLTSGEQSVINRASTQSGLVTRLFDENPFGGFSNIQSRPETGVKTYEGLTPEALAQLPTHKVRQVMSNSNPHVSAATTDFQEYVKPGWKIYPESHPVIDNWIDNMERNDGVGIDGFIDQISESMFLHGAYAYESVYDDNGVPQRIVALDPYSIVFTRSNGPYGDFYEVHQRQRDAEFGLRSLHGESTFEYRPLYSQVGNPYGKSLIDAALFHLVMVVEFFKSYKDVLQTLVWPALMMRVDRSVLAEDIKDPVLRQKVVNEVLVRLKEELKKLGPGAVIAQGSEVMEPEILSGMNRATLGSVQDFIDILDRQIIIALKSNQLLFAKSDSFTETRAMYEMNHYALLVNHAQKFINRSLTRQMNLALFRNAIFGFLVDFRLDRSIFEEERLLAQINKVVQDANVSFDNAMMSLLGWLAEAELSGRMTKPDADVYFANQLQLREGQMLLKRVY